MGERKSIPQANWILTANAGDSVFGLSEGILLTRLGAPLKCQAWGRANSLVVSCLLPVYCAVCYERVSAFPVALPAILLQDTFWCFFCQDPEEQSYYGKFLSLPQVREAIHVGNRTFSDGADVEKYLREDTLQSVKPWLAEIMDHYKVSRGPGRREGVQSRTPGPLWAKGTSF